MINAMIRKVDTKLKQCENKLKRKNETLKMNDELRTEKKTSKE